jgi:hypothetical protein
MVGCPFSEACYGALRRPVGGTKSPFAPFVKWGWGDFKSDFIGCPVRG